MKIVSRKHALKLALMALSVVSATQASVAAGRTARGHGFVHTRGTEIVAADGEPIELRGINLGNWLEPEGYMFEFGHGVQSPTEIYDFFDELVGPEKAETFWQQYRANYITETDIAKLHDAGFNSVRVPLHWKLFQQDDSEGFRLVDQVVAWGRKYGVYVILDLHCAPGGQTGTNIDDSAGYPWLYDSPKERQLTVATWLRIARHYRTNPTVIGYDLLNEPIPHYPKLARYNADLEPVYREITKAIRTVDTRHMLFLGGAQWDSNFKVFGPPFDSNVVYTFHKYWTAPDESVIAEYLAYRTRYNVPIWLGESGENDDAWIAKFTAVLEANKIGWAFWPFKKMKSASAVVTILPPTGWDAIVAFSKEPRGTGSAEARLKVRPDQSTIDQALASFLDQVKFANCRVNEGYLHALGLTPVEGGASTAAATAPTP